MTIALGWLLLCAAWGVLASTRLRTPLGPGGRAAIGLGLGVALQLWLPAVLSIACGIVWGPRLAVGATLGLFALELCRPDARRTLAADWRELRAVSKGTRVLLVLFALLAALLLHLFFKHAIRVTPEGAFSVGYSYNDMAYHATLASSFLKGDNLWPPEYPPLAHHPLGYPFVPDLLAAALASLGCELGPAFAWSGWLCSLAFVLLLFQLARRWAGSDLAGAVAVVLFLFSGGLGVFQMLARAWEGMPLRDALLGTDYTFCHEIGVDYSNMVVGALLPSRCVLYGMTLALVVLELLSRALERDLEPRRDVVVAGAVAGMIPLVHAHSVVALALLIGTWMLVFPQPWKRWARFVAPCVLLALPQVAWIAHYLAASPSEGFSHLEPGWMSGASNVLEWGGYWVVNGGVFLILCVPAWILAPFTLKRLAAPAIVLFGAANLLRLQPWVYDNIRLIGYAHVLAAVPLARWLARARTPTAIVLASEVVLLATLTGACTIAREALIDVHGFQLCGADGVAFADLVDRTTPKNAVFLTAGVHTHPVSMLAGRRLVLGADCWLYTHGVPYTDRIDRVKEIFRGGPDAKRWLEQYRVDYVVVGPDERRSFPDLDERFLARVSLERRSDHGFTLYRMR